MPSVFAATPALRRHSSAAATPIAATVSSGTDHRHSLDSRDLLDPLGGAEQGLGQFRVRDPSLGQVRSERLEVGAH